MLPVLTSSHWIALWFRYLKLGWGLRRLAADRRSRLAMIYLGATTLFRSRPGKMHKPVRLSVRLGAKSYRIALQTQTELDTLQEIGIEDEYRPADAIPASRIVDLGASVGLATLRLLSSHPEARVIAVEADPVLIPRLRANVEGLSVTVVAAAVGGASGQRSFYRSDADSWGNSLERTSDRQTAVTVPVLSLAELFDENDLDRVDLMKLDVEGAEWEILDDSSDQLFRSQAIIGEIHGRDGREPDEFVKRLSQSMQVETISAETGRATFLATRA